MVIGLLTAGIVLNTLGVTDFGIYNIVAGFVSMFTFLNSSMSSATQRFLSFDLGKKDYEKLRKTFSATVSIHIVIGLLIVIALETFGLWYINYKLNVPPERLYAVNIVFQFSVLSTFFGIIQVPYNALITAHERFNVYAYISFLEIAFKLSILFLIVHVSYDKLILYAGLLFISSFIIRMIYRIYCRRNFPESHYFLYYDKAYFKEIVGFTGWNLFGSVAAVGRGQGNNLLLNAFFGTALNAAYGITYQVSSVISSFVSSFQVAINPQVIKSYANKEYQRSIFLIKVSSKFSYLIMLIMVVPVVFNIEYILSIWLKEVPPYTPSFIQLCIIGVMLDVISNPLMTAARATGEIKWYQITISALIMLSVPLSYISIKITNNPNWVFIFIAILNFIALGFRIYFLNKMMQLSIKDFFKDVLLKIIICTIITLLLIYGFYLIFSNPNSLAELIVYSGANIIITSAVILLLGTNKKERDFIKNIVIHKIRKNES